MKEFQKKEEEEEEEKRWKQRKKIIIKNAMVTKSTKSYKTQLFTYTLTLPKGLHGNMIAALGWSHT